MPTFDPNLHQRRSIRLRGYDYSQAGAYFVTIVTWRRETLFGDVVNGVMVLNDFGGIVREEWERTAFIRPRVVLGAFVIMPNHIHGILTFTDNVVNDVNAGATRRVAPASSTTLQSGSLGAVIGQFKSIVTKRINGLQNVSGRPVWQRNYHERIIRDEGEMDRITRYIEANPSRWAEDKENPHSK
ncbi:MAG: transposase [Chloroflexota bacterium]